MFKSKAFYISCALIMTLAKPVFSAETGGHSVYRVTSYNFGYLGGQTETGSGRISAELPLMITGYQSDVLTDMNLDDETLLTSAKSSATGGFALAAEYSPNNSRLSFMGAFGLTSSDWDPGSDRTEASWEANLGIIYNLFNNVSYGVHFGYMETGDVYQRRDTYSDVESVIMVSNQLTLSF